MTNKKIEQAFNKLNEEQLKAVKQIFGPLLVIAGPGSGKTQLLSLRIINILKETDTEPGNILCLTFTDSAAHEMRERLVGFIGNDAYRVNIHTFHSFGSYLMREFPEHFHNGHDFKPANPIENKEVFNVVLQNLDIANPLSSFSEEHGFAFQKDVEDNIKNLRQAGISPKAYRELIKWNEGYFDKINEIFQSFPARIGKKSIDEALNVLHDLLRLADDEMLHGQGSFGLFIANQAQFAIAEYEMLDKTTPITNFKNKFFEKSESGTGLVLKYTERIDKLYGLADAYENYLDELYKRGIYDFDSMILDAIDAMAESDNLLYQIQEKFQFVLVDEFQDTSPAQLRIIELLSFDPIDDYPNLLAVGDDDQAIYSFQGADRSNIDRFIKKFPRHELVVLDKNYRSSQEILDLAMFNIDHSENRLTKTVDEFNKNLKASNGAIIHGDIEATVYNDIESERFYVVQKIKELLLGGVSAEDIAIISRKNEHLKAMAGELLAEEIPVFYEKDTNIFENERILEIIDLLRLLTIWTSYKKEEVDVLLKRVLDQEHFGIDSLDIAKISVDAYRDRVSLAIAAKGSTNEKVRKVIDLLNYFSKKVEYTPAEKLIHDLIGGSDEENCTKIKACYFDEAKKGERLEFYTTYSTFINSLREYNKGSVISIKDVIDYFDTAKINNIIIKDTHPIRKADEAISLLTAHKSKGMEFKYVFIIHADNATWSKSGKGSKIKIPDNIKIKVPNDINEIIRLQYVALTRAKTHLYISRYKVDANGKDLHKLATLNIEEKFIGDKALNIRNHDSLIRKFTSDENEFIKALASEHILNATSLNNFLNLEREGGPHKFIENNLYHFPSMRSYHSELGSLIHDCLFELYSKKLDKKQLMDILKTKILGIRMEPADIEKIQYEAEKILDQYFDLKFIKYNFEEFDDYWYEKDFRTHIDDIPFRGAIDAVEIMKDKTVRVIDYKTGKGFSKFDSNAKTKAGKIHQYKRQIYIYALLIEAAKPNYKVDSGMIQFVVPENNKIYEPSILIDPIEKERVKKLIKKVYNLIINGVFPDISKYSADVEGTMQFEEDILNDIYG